MFTFDFDYFMYKDLLIFLLITTKDLKIVKSDTAEI